MFGLFAKRRGDSTTATEQTFGTVEVEDLTVAFAMMGGNLLTKEFISYATFYPLASDREDGVCIGDMDHRLAIFMERWKSNEYAIIGDTIARFSDFMRATITREKRIVHVRVRACVA